MVHSTERREVIVGNSNLGLLVMTQRHDARRTVDDWAECNAGHVFVEQAVLDGCNVELTLRWFARRGSRASGESVVGGNVAGLQSSARA
ncbi:hypothetical protein ON010_g9171 [Phytophthora cinnamomi]|nr:hypothetical protein ON010_g9171 [Phytophthora cinnamomi]